MENLVSSCKDDVIVAQAKRGTSADLGQRHKMNSSLFLKFGFPRYSAENQTSKKGRKGVGRALPGAAVAPLLCPGLLCAALSRAPEAWHSFPLLALSEEV